MAASLSSSHSPLIHRNWRRIACAFVTGAVFLGGCSIVPTGLPKPLPHREERMKNGYVYYLDGAGGGTARTNWAAGVRKGMLASGYRGAGEMFSWETGLGLLVDQDADDNYKRAKAKALALEIIRREKAIPEAPVHILGFSAGTVEAIFALEYLPANVQVENVVLLGCSISEDYDLTRALRQVKGHVYLYTSTRDRMLGFLMPFTGTADRKFLDPGAGITGFVVPRHASAETRKLYAEKLVTIAWTAQLEKDGDYGRHFDNIKMQFVRDQVAPLVMGQPCAGLPVCAAGMAASTIMHRRPVSHGWFFGL
jgi:pimeloyl-ACP methyl ester carboxylesterase